MHVVAKVLAGIVALEHLYILVLEMFLWESRGPKVFSSFPKDLFAPTKAMAANQGLYNGFLAAGLIWAIFFIKDSVWQKRIALFFLSCVAIAGIYGAATVTPRIFYIQAVPALLAIAATAFMK